MQHSTKKLGMMFTLGGWIVGFLVLALAFSKILDQQANPNQSVATSITAEYREVVLERNRRGHYVFNGEINQRPVTFLIDTGATMTSIPLTLKDYLGLHQGTEFRVSTANGEASAYATQIEQLKMGEIVLQDIRGSLNPGLPDKSILLGMNVLRNLELIQRGDLLMIRQYL